VLVVEDDFFLAEDEKETLESVGATVLGPCADAAEAFALLSHQRPDCAVLDVNLGGAPSFDLARAMSAQAIPMLFATGYDASVIPPDLAHIPRLQKPVDLRALISAVAELRAAGQGRA
jgi:CheY-like chemotaxis protein